MSYDKQPTLEMPQTKRSKQRYSSKTIRPSTEAKFGLVHAVPVMFANIRMLT